MSTICFIAFIVAYLVPSRWIKLEFFHLSSVVDMSYAKLMGLHAFRSGLDMCRLCHCFYIHQRINNELFSLLVLDIKIGYVPMIVNNLSNNKKVLFMRLLVADVLCDAGASWLMIDQNRLTLIKRIRFLKAPHLVCTSLLFNYSWLASAWHSKSLCLLLLLHRWSKKEFISYL